MIESKSMILVLFENIKCPRKWICRQATGEIFFKIDKALKFPSASYLVFNLDKIAEL
jgi:hypothetical protein